jgi:excisionase family DNA binding protein
VKPKETTDNRQPSATVLKAVLKAAGGDTKVRELFQLLTADEAASFLALDSGTVRNLTYRRELPCVRVGIRGVRYRVLDLVAWQEARSRPALNK